MQFYLKNEDRVYFDPKQQVIKLIFEIGTDNKSFQQQVPKKWQQKLSFKISSKNVFSLFLRKIRNMTFLSLILIEFDSFNERDVDIRR